MFVIHQITKININTLGIGVMVSTTDFDSVCRGSSPLSLTNNALIAQLVLEHSTFNAGVLGSSPSGRTTFHYYYKNISANLFKQFMK